MSKAPFINEINPELPGNLGDAFDRFAPDLPTGSWERLSDLRKKKKRSFFWWIVPCLILGLGLASWLLLPKGDKVDAIGQTFAAAGKKQSAGSKTQAAAGETPDAESVKPATAKKTPAAAGKTLGSQTESHDAQSRALGAAIKTPGAENEVQRAATKALKMDLKEKNGPLAMGTKKLIIRDEFSQVLVDEQEIERQNNQTKRGEAISTLSKNGKSKPMTDVKNQPTYVNQPDIDNNDKDMESEKNTVQQDAAGIKRFAAPKTIEVVAKNTLSGTVDKNDDLKLEQSDLNIPKSKDISKAIKPSDISTNSETKNLENPLKTSALLPDNQKPVPVYFPDVTQNISADSVQELDSIQIQPNEKADNGILAQLDSAKQKAIQKQKFGFEIGLGALLVGQSLKVTALDLNTEKTVQEPLQVKPMRGGNLSLKVRIPLSSRWSILPGADFAMLSQSVQYMDVAGALTPIKLTKTADGFVGVPRAEERIYWKSRWLLMPSAGLEISYRLNLETDVRAGVNIAWFEQSGSEDSPIVNVPAYLVALHYQIKKRWMLRTECRYFSTSQSIPGPDASSQNLMLGVGIVWR